MSSAEQHHPSSFPTVPPSLSASDHGMREYYGAEDRQRPTPHTVSNITPYLGLRSRLSQVWINRWTILLLLVLVRILIAISGLNNELDSAKTEAMSACSGVEFMGSTMASMPHYLSAGVNELAANGVEKAVSGLMSMLLLTVTGIEELVVFYINMLTQTYFCLITLVVAGSLHVALQVAEDATTFLNNTLKGISNDIGSSVNAFQNDLNKFTSDINSVPDILGKKGNSIPKIDVNSSLTKLNDLALPSTLDEGLTKLNASIPNFQQVQNFTEGLIRLPFEDVKKLINGSIHYNFNRSLLPVPQKEQLSFCSDNNGISDFFDDLAGIANLARRIFIAVLVILAILVCIPMALQEIRRWNTMKKRSELVADKSLDPLDVIYIASRPYTATAGIKAADHFHSSKRQILTRWVVAYATSTPALLVLSLGITGLLACLCQYILLKAVVKEVPHLANEVGQFADLVVNKLNNASEAWSNGTNAAIVGTNNEINHNVLGWVNTSTTAINNTLNMFINDTTNVLNDTFGGTVLYGPVQGIFECLIGLKVASFQKGLDWVSDNAKVDFPTLPNDTFSLGAAASIADSTPQNSSNSFLASPSSQASDQITNAVVKVTTHIADAIRNEAIISTCILLIWLLIVLMGVARALYLALKHNKSRAEGGPSHAGDIPMQDQRNADHRYSTSGPAPAYEPPKNNITTTTTVFPSFAEPIGTVNRTRRAVTPNAEEGESEWQDRKLGFGGLREPAEQQRPSAGHQSSYGFVEKS